ncbi:M1 family metallopeptidase [Fluviicola taffensis]|uniref:Aminopeptidase N n=1 Tax=Fluviicola taffensis (strain DSM 16823 / NCIMB 13979 / RW262) TaxID=755732 RepID=F2IIA2_FLUTR|nr:M1 family metallopeptidase [Fluviicola taffensis]AEA43811.1 Membrane alanyl aminopeptidase [Fluviicola taffensis DSM 16823]
MKKINYLVALVLVACQPKHSDKENTVGKSNTETTTSIEEPKQEEPKVYHASRTVLTDLIHTKLEVSFDWAKSWLIGKETLQAKPHYYASSELILDAKGMEIKSVSMAGKACIFEYKEDVLTIQLDKKYTRDENYTVVIDYISKPDERKTGGSSAITSDKGLYFINPRGEEPNKMPQIWTQGETQSNSVWFPTIDSPNSKTKEEIYITVEDKYTTLSNGKLISSTKNANGTRTDYWKQDLAHAPYLFMMGVGEFKIVKDTYKRPDGTNMEVNYYVEPEWEKDAKAIFGETPAMIGFFSQLLGVEYPWDKYSQIIVRDYVSGAMENTGAVVFGEYAYKTQRELLDNNDNSTIAHELFHHWFGDLVTAESWSNLTLNESFANYSQFLWDEHRHGLDEAEYQAIQEADGYFASAEQGGYHNLVWFDYNSREDMFDGHSYNKGGRILHMLRKYIGDEAFFLGLKNYLKQNQFKAAEFHQLRLAFEDVSGQDLNWFFNQWYLGKGHPTLDVSYKTDATTVSVTVNQKQKAQFGLFKLPVDVTVYDDRGATTTRHWFNDESTTVSIPTQGTVKNVIFDSEAMLLGKLEEHKDASWYAFQWNNSKHFIHRQNALKKVPSSSPDAGKIALEGLIDPFWDIRATSIDKIGKLSNDNKTAAINRLKKMASSDSVSAVRVAAITALAGIISAPELEQLCTDALQKDQSYAVMSAALTQLSKVNYKSALEICKRLESEPSAKMQTGVAMIYAKYGDADQMTYFENVLKSNSVQGFDKIGVLNSMTFFASRQDTRIQKRALPIYEKEYKTGGMYAQMFVPQYIGYLRDNLLNSIEKYKVEEEKAKKEGNTNATDIARGKRMDAEALVADYDKMIAGFPKDEKSEKGH